MTIYYPYTHLFPGPSHTVAISGPHIQVINTTTGDVLHSTTLFTDEARNAVLKSGPVRCAAVDKPSKYLITTGEDKILKLWEVDGLKLLSERELPKKPTGLAFSADAQSILASDKFGDIFRYPFDYDPSTVTQKKDALSSHENPSGGQLILGHASPLNAFLLTHDERYIITADRDEHIRVSWYPQGYNIEMYCLGHSKFVSAIHVPQFDQSKLISGGGDPDLKIWDWMTGEVKHAIDVADAIDPFLVVRAVKRRRGGHDDDEEDEAVEGNGSKRRKGKGRAKGKDKQEEEKESEEGPIASSSQTTTDNAEKVLVIRKIGSLEADGVPTVIFSAVGATALFTLPYRDGVTMSNIRHFDFGRPITDFAIANDGLIWILLDSEWTPDGVPSGSGSPFVKVLQFSLGQLVEAPSGSHSALLLTLNETSLLEASVDDIKKLSLYIDLQTMPKYADKPEETEETTAEDTSDKKLSNKELGRMKRKQIVLAKAGGVGVGEGEEEEEPLSKKNKSEL